MLFVTQKFVISFKMQCRALSDISEQNIDAILIPTVNCIENIFCMQQNKKIFLKKIYFKSPEKTKAFHQYH